MHLRLIQKKIEQPTEQPRRSFMPFGWSMDEFGPRPVAGEQWVLTYARKMREFGYTYKEISQQLNRDGHLARNDEKWRAGDIVELLDLKDELLWVRWRKRKEK